MKDNYNNNFDQLLKKFNQMTEIAEKQIINATVLCLDNSKKYVVFDIYSKSENKVPVKEFDKIPEQGEVFPLYVVSMDSKGEVILSYKRAKKELRKKQLIESMGKKEILEGIIIGKNYNNSSNTSFNGYKVNLGDVIGFLPKTQIHSFQRIKDKDNFDNEKFQFLVTSIDENRDIINLVMVDDLYKKYNFKDMAGSKIKERDVVEGEIIAIEDYGCFFAIDNQYLGFVKINDLSSNKRIEHPSEIVHIGEKIKAKVMNVEPNRVRCSISLLDNQSMEDITTRFIVGNIYKAKISSIINHGCYVVLDDGLPIESGAKKRRIDGFVESSEMSWNESDFYKNKFKIGDIINFKVLAIDMIISGSCKQCNMDIFDNFCQQFEENSLVSVTINHVNRNKAIGEIVLNNNEIISALIDKKEFHWDYNLAISEFNKIKDNQNLQKNTKIIRINKDNFNIELSIRRTEKDPIDLFMEKHTPSSNAIEAEVGYVNDNFALLSVDQWKNILILYKSGEWNLKLKSKIKVNIGKLDKRNKYDRHIMAYRADGQKKSKESYNNSLADNIQWS